jgi:hypothetical protein
MYEILDVLQLNMRKQQMVCTALMKDKQLADFRLVSWYESPD